MKICAAQTGPSKGDIHKNIDQHIQFIDLAVGHGADMIVFPELSLTGYEPALAQTYALDPDDSRLDIFQSIANAEQITIGLGLPTRHDPHLWISMLIFQARQPRLIYSKKYLHPDEETFFASGRNFPSFMAHKTSVAPAICYELTVPEHAERAAQSGANIYIASVAKSAAGVAQASQRLADIARQYKMPAIMVNSVGPADDFISAGKSAVWLDNGLLAAQLGASEEGLLIFDTGSRVGSVIKL